MKKFISILLLAAMVLSLLGCGATPATNQDTETTSTAAIIADSAESTEATEPAQQTGSSEKTFRVGYARYDITPQEPVPLGGFGNCDKRIFTTITSRLYVTCVALTDEQDYTVLMFGCDFINPYASLMNARPVVSTATGVPEHQILINSSHTHAGPDQGSSQFESIQRWIALVNEQMVAAGQAAMADRKPATMSYGSIETENMNFIKHYKYTDADGNIQYFGDNFGTAVYDETTTHTTQIDETMYVLKFDREGDKPVVMASWRAHPLLDGGSSRTELSADYIGTFRDAVEMQMDCNFVYYQGAAGNNNSSSRLNNEVRTKDTREYGALLAGYLLDALESNMTDVGNPGPIQSRYTLLESEINHDTDDLYMAAREVTAVWQATNVFAEAKAVGMPYGIRSPYMANAIVSRYNKGDTAVSELNAVAFGEHVAFVSAPNELFDQLGEMTEAGSSYPMTVTLGYTNGYTGYIPTLYGFEHTSYETDVCWFKPGIGETMVDTFLTMLDEMDG